MTVSTALVPSIELITQPSHELLAKWWAVRTAQPEEVMYAFADDSPGFTQFVEAVDSGDILCVMTATEEGELTATSWLHDLSVDHEGKPRIGWLGGYVFPDFRGALSIPAIHTILGYFEDIGIEHIHTSVMTQNKRSIAYIRNRRLMAFTEVCTVEDWSRLNGQPFAVKVFTRYAHDRMLAWINTQELAAKRQARFRDHVNMEA